MTLPVGLLSDPFGQGAPLAPPIPPPAQPSILDRLLNRLFPTGNYSGLLSPQDQQGVQRQGLLQLGTNLLQLGGARPSQPGTLANIGAALGGVDVNALANHALQLQAYKSAQNEQQLIADAAARHPLNPNASPADRYAQLSAFLGEIASVPGGAAIAEKYGPVLAALKPPDHAGKEPMRVADVRDNVPGSPTHGMIGTVLLDPVSYQRVGFIPQVDKVGQLTGMEEQKYSQQADFGAAALAAWRPIEQLRQKNPGVEAEVGKILTDPKFAEAVPGFRSAGDAVAAIARAGGSQAAQQYMRAKWAFMDNIARTRYPGARMSGQLFQQLQYELMPGLDVEGNTQMRSNEVQNLISAQGQAGYDTHPEIWNRVAKRHGVGNIDLQAILSGQGVDSRLNQVNARY